MATKTTIVDKNQQTGSETDKLVNKTLVRTFYLLSHTVPVFTYSHVAAGPESAPESELFSSGKSKTNAYRMYIDGTLCVSGF